MLTLKYLEGEITFIKINHEHIKMYIHKRVIFDSSSTSSKKSKHTNTMTVFIETFDQLVNSKQSIKNQRVIMKKFKKSLSNLRFIYIPVAC